ncbi:hypothetical protein LZ32DRAFT_50251 [Colletotrichum eremochloae]|nr:hypothetical protein LZ32DRAFT_50251 [Colletotrichum eremochloae]
MPRCAHSTQTSPRPSLFRTVPLSHPSRDMRLNPSPLPTRRDVQSHPRRTTPALGTPPPPPASTDPDPLRTTVHRPAASCHPRGADMLITRMTPQ